MRKNWNLIGKRDEGKLGILRLVLALPIVFSVIAFDQVTKYFAPTWFSTIVCNTGFAFGIYQGFLNGLVAALVLLGLIYIFAKNSSSDILFGLALIIGGGMSNFTDRLLRGCVVDFIQWSSLSDLPLPNWLQASLARWPAFNLADGAIMLGVTISLISLAKDFKNNVKNS